MTKKEVAELKRRLKKEECTFTRLCGCYVDAQKNIILHINETFLNLADEEFYKYLEIAKKALSGTIGNNLLPLSFHPKEEETGGKQQFLLGLRDSKLKNEALLLRFYELIIENYTYAGNYLILVFHDAYDVITKTKDNEKLDESEEVYEYLLCAVCPVELTKAGLGYREEENRIGARIRDWVVTAPETGFLFPAFSDRSSDIHSVLYYTKNARTPNAEFMESVLGCRPKKTAAEEKAVFQHILQTAFGTEEEETKAVFMEIQQNLKDMIEEQDAFPTKESVVIDSGTMQNILLDNGLSEEAASKIQASLEKEFGDAPPKAENLIDEKVLAESLQKKEKQQLHQQLHFLKQQLEESKINTQTEPVSAINSFTKTEFDENSSSVVLKINPQIVPEIKTQIFEGRKCILIPLEDEAHITINGIETEIL